MSQGIQNQSGSQESNSVPRQKARSGFRVTRHGLSGTPGGADVVCRRGTIGSCPAPPTGLCPSKQGVETIFRFHSICKLTPCLGAA